MQEWGAVNSNGSKEEDAEGRIVMGLGHKTHSHWGVQFHPESVGTKYGAQILQNFRQATVEHLDNYSQPGRRSHCLWGPCTPLSLHIDLVVCNSLSVHLPPKLQHLTSASVKPHVACFGKECKHT